MKKVFKFHIFSVFFLFLTIFLIKALKMLICYGCSASVHLFCYGINTPYNIERSPDSPREDYMFLCLKCREKGPDFQPVY